MKYRLSLLPCLAAVAACATTPQPREFIDESTANTLLVTESPLVFARERSDVAAHARDYVTMVGLEIDSSGNYGEYLLTYRWSTVDPRMAPPPSPDAGRLSILADGRMIELAPLERLPLSLTPPERLLVPNHGNVIAHAYRVDAATLRYVAGSRTIVLRLSQEPLDLPFALWSDGRAALSAFLARAAAP